MRNIELTCSYQNSFRRTKLYLRPHSLSFSSFETISSLRIFNIQQIAQKIYEAFSEEQYSIRQFHLSSFYVWDWIEEIHPALKHDNWCLIYVFYQVYTSHLFFLKILINFISVPKGRLALKEPREMGMKF